MSAAPSAPASEPPLSPCIRDCHVEADTGLCRGCNRSLDEIARWSGLTNPERAVIMATLAARRA